VLNDPADVPTLAAAMREMLDDNMRTMMRQACLSLRQSLSYEEHLNRLCTLYAGGSQLS
jgi:phage gp29-like protein